MWLRDIVCTFFYNFRSDFENGVEYFFFVFHFIGEHVIYFHFKSQLLHYHFDNKPFAHSQILGVSSLWAGETGSHSYNNGKDKTCEHFFFLTIV